MSHVVLTLTIVLCCALKFMAKRGFEFLNDVGCMGFPRSHNKELFQLCKANMCWRESRCWN